MTVAPYNSLPLLSVKPGLDASLGQLSQELEQYFSTGGVSKSSLELALVELHRVRGVLQMLSMTGVAVFSGELEKLLQEMLEQDTQLTTERRDIIRRALFGMTHYLDAVANGASNATLRLFHEYQDILQARGIEVAFESDLFFPELDAELPEEVLRTAPDENALAAIKGARTQYQQALLKWLRGDQRESLRTMRSSIQTTLESLPQNEQRAFWWIATGLIDCLMHDGLPPELSAKKLLGRIDLQMKSLVDSHPMDADATLHEMLYLLARSHSVTETVEAIKQAYVLDAYLPEEIPLPPSEIAQILQKMREHLTAASETWERCVTEDREACARFMKQAEQLYELSEKLDRNTLQFLGKQIQTSAAHLEDPERAPRIALDMAMALLLLSSGVEHYQHLGSGFHEQARILSNRLQAGLMRMPEDVSKLANLISLYCQMEQREVLAPLASEMQGNLQHVEQSLNAFFGNAAKRSELSQLNRLLSQVQGGLHMLSLDVGVQLLGMLRQLTDRYVKGETPAAQEMRAVADTVSALEGYVHDLRLGQRPDTANLKRVLDEIVAARDAAGHAPEPEPEQAEPTGVSIRAGGEDEELLEVFLEEAREVMETLRSNLEISRLHMDSREPLVIMRRAFHTLKGSGRMVGLTELGEVAWAVERAMNKWLQENKPAKPVLLDMIGDAEVLFQHWVDMLRSNKQDGRIDASQLVMAANRLEEGNETPLEIRTPHAEAVAEPQPEPVVETPEQVVIGEVSLSATLFGIATEEAANHVRTLQKHWNTLREAQPPVVTYDFMRAAHTLAGVNRTMGFKQIAELAYALELWLEERIDKPITVSPEHWALLDQTVSRLDELCALVRERQEPPAQPDLIERLHAARELIAGEVLPASVPEHLPSEEDFGVNTMVIQRAVLEAEAMAQQPTAEGVSEEASVEAPVEDVVSVLEMPVVPDVESIPAPELEAPAPVEALSFESEQPVAEPVSEPVLTAELVELPEPAAEIAPADIELPSGDAGLESEPVVTVAAPELEPVSEPEEVVSQEAAEEEQEVVQEDTRTVHDEVDEQLLPIFLEEAHDLYPQISRTLRAWQEQPSDTQQSHLLQRALHTLKGSARMAGAMRLGELTHRVEGRIGIAVSTGQVNEAFWEELNNYLDRIGAAIDQLEQGDHAPLQEAAPEPEPKPEAAPEAPLAPAVAEAAIPVEEETPLPAQPVAAQPVKQALEVGAERAIQGALLRVRSNIVDKLVNEAGEISVTRSRAELELREFKNSVLELTESVHRLRQQLREIEIQAESQMEVRTLVSGESAEKFDPLEFDRFTRFQELTRFMNESVHDVQTVQQALLKNLAETEAALTAQSQLNRDLQQELMAIRMVPFSSVSERLYRIVRQTAKELGKRANLDLSGTEVELDRSVLEKMAAPFEHLLRNAISHGLEMPEQRLQAGKDTIGEIRLSLRQESNEVVFEFSDDGTGINLARLKEKSIERGLLKADEEVSDEQLVQLIFTPGLSTADQITEISGRGVGLDVVRSEISALGGRVDVSSVPGHGTRFIIHLPLTLAVTKVLMVRAGAATYAIPSTMVELVQQLKPAGLESAYQQRHLLWQGNSYPLHHLARVLGNEEIELVSRPHNAVLLLRSGDSRIALHVDELLGNQEVVVKNIGPQLARLTGVVGATVAANGEVVLIINPVAYSQRIVPTHKAVTQAEKTEEPVKTLPLVMVVDDSLTVRKITSRLLTRAGYLAVTAKDGVDALEQLAELEPVVMLLDVEMPRMDGFELAKRLRQDSKTRNLPIIMITSRTADKHRNYALELGVNVYLGKPYQEEELLQHIAQFAGQAGTA